VTPEAREHIDRAREYLARAFSDVLHYDDEAARAADLASPFGNVLERGLPLPIHSAGVRKKRQNPRLTT
jgi:hypothetical protein